ncbi:MAG: hypothetical protein M1825_001909 [Sarcosagium campestre]|nr:MAG: hypothetical protein M1825_001909 [Sarcosagium campestre]
MRGIQVTEYVNGPNELQVSSLPDPVPRSNEYLIDYQNQPSLPWISGSEFAGVVVRTPSAEDAAATPPKFKVGDSVFGASQGAYATRIAATEQSLLPIPKGWSFTDAAGLFVTAPTSYAALVERARVQPGEYVLVHAAAGGVGLAAVQVAKALGATVIATAGSPRKLAVARAYGADHTINYASEQKVAWPEAVRALTPAGRGVDVVFDPVGKIIESTKCMAWNARLVVVGFAAGKIEAVPANRLLLKNISVMGVHWGKYATMEPQTAERIWEELFVLMVRRRFRPTVFTDKEFVGLESVPAALNALAGRENWGKVVVKVPADGQSNL